MELRLTEMLQNKLRQEWVRVTHTPPSGAVTPTHSGLNKTYTTYLSKGNHFSVLHLLHTDAEVTMQTAAVSSHGFTTYLLLQ